jgi:hexosaminidase
MSGAVQLWQLPISVEDRPRFKYRGIKVDTSRHFISIPHLQNIIRGMEAAKCNVFQVPTTATEQQPHLIAANCCC